MSIASISIKYATSTTERNKKFFWIGFLTVTIVVCFVSLMQCIARGSDYLIVRIAEKQVGEQDAIISSYQSNYLLNQTELDHSISHSSHSQGTGRLILPAAVNTNSYYNLNTEFQNKDVMCILIALDDIHEKEIGFGKSWKYPPLNENEVIISSSLASSTNTQIGESLLLTMNLSKYFTNSNLTYLYEYLNQLNLSDQQQAQIQKTIQSNLIIQKEFRVVNTIDSPDGKWPVSYGSVVVVSLIEMRRIMKQEIQNLLKHSYSIIQLEESIEQEIIQGIDSFTMYYFILSNRHQSLYTSTNMNEEFLSYANTLMNQLPHPNEISIQYLLYNSLQSLSSITLLLQQVFLMIDLIITLVAAYIIHILLSSRMKDQIFEMALLRTIGLQQLSIPVILLIQILFFVLPGILVGILLSIGISILMAYFLNSYLSLNLPFLPPSSSYYYSIPLGFITPIIAILPSIYSIIKQKLINLLDSQHSIQKQSQIHIIDNRQSPLSFHIILYGCLFTCIGILIFLSAINAFLNEDMKRFMTILNIILILSLLGLTICSTLFSSILSKCLLFLLTRFKSIRCCSLFIRHTNNLHKQQSFDLSLLTTISITFIIFSSCLLHLQTNTLYSTIRMNIPSDLFISSSHLDEDLLKSFLTSSHYSSTIDGYEFIQKPITSSLQLTTYSFYSSSPAIIQPLSSNYLNLVDKDLIDYHGDLPLSSFLDESSPINQSIPYPQYDIRSFQYPDLMIQKQYQFFIPAIFPLSIHHDIISDSQSNLVSYYHTDQTIQHQSIGYLRRLPGLQFSKYNYLKHTPTILISNYSYKHLFPKQPHSSIQLLIKIRKDLSDSEYSSLVDSTRSLLQDDQSATFAERKTLIKSIQSVENALDVYFYVVSALCCILLFFASWISIESLVKSTSSEMGIFLSLGGNVKQLYYILSIESLSTFIASSFTGIIIGILVATLVSFQMNLLTEGRFSLSIPYYLILGIILLLIILSLISVNRSTSQIMKLPIAFLAKGGKMKK